MKEKPRTFVAKKNLYSYLDEDCWSDDSPTEYGKYYGATAKEVRDNLLQDTIRKGTRLSLIKNDSGMYSWCPYGLAKKNGDIVVYLENENYIDLNFFEEVSE